MGLIPTAKTLSQQKVGADKRLSTSRQVVLVAKRKSGQGLGENLSWSYSYASDDQLPSI